ncbi:40393_t:CDS:2, partial [Gigaspora margarita]
MRDLQEKGIGEIQGAHALSLEEMAIIFACHSGEYYYIKADQLKQQEDSINGENGQIIPIPADYP